MDPEVVSYRSTAPAPTPDKATSRWERFQAKHPIATRTLLGAAVLTAGFLALFVTIYSLGHIWLLIAPGTAPTPGEPAVCGTVALFFLIAVPLVCFLLGSLITPPPWRQDGTPPYS